MPLKPDFSRHIPDPRFTPFRDRVARLSSDGDPVGLLLVRVEPHAEIEAGRLWWRRWGTTFDMLWLWVIVQGRFSDTVVPRDHAESELRDWARSRFRYHGELLHADWLSSEESERLSRLDFGVDG